MAERTSALHLYALCFVVGSLAAPAGTSNFAFGQGQQYESYRDEGAPDWEEVIHREEALHSSSRAVPEKDIERNDPEADRKDADAAARAQKEGRWLDDERYPEFIVPVILRWPEAWEGSEPAQVRSTDFVVTIENQGAEAITLETALTVDLADQRIHRYELGEIQVEKHNISRLPFALPKDLSVDEMRYSGQLMITVQNAVLPAPASSAPLFFHPLKNDHLLVYNEDVLIARFTGGDFAGRHNYTPDMGTISTRVIHGGEGQVSYKRVTAEEVLTGGNDE